MSFPTTTTSTFRPQRVLVNSTNDTTRIQSQTTQPTQPTQPAPTQQQSQPTFRQIPITNNSTFLTTPQPKPYRTTGTDFPNSISTIRAGITSTPLTRPTNPQSTQSFVLQSESNGPDLNTLNPSSLPTPLHSLTPQPTTKQLFNQGNLPSRVNTNTTNNNNNTNNTLNHTNNTLNNNTTTIPSSYTSRRIGLSSNTTATTTSQQPQPSLTNHQPAPSFATYHTNSSSSIPAPTPVVSNTSTATTNPNTTTTTTTTTNAFNRSVASKPKPISQSNNSSNQHQQANVLGLFAKNPPTPAVAGGTGFVPKSTQFGSKQSILTLQDEYNTISTQLKQLQSAYSELQQAYNDSQAEIIRIQKQKDDELSKMQFEFESQLTNLRLELLQSSQQTAQYESSLGQMEVERDNMREIIVDEMLQVCESAGFDRVEMTAILNFEHPSSQFFSPETQKALETIKTEQDFEENLLDTISDVLTSTVDSGHDGIENGTPDSDDNGEENQNIQNILKSPSRLQLAIDQLIQASGSIDTTGAYWRKMQSRIDDIETLQMKSDELDQQLARNIQKRNGSNNSNHSLAQNQIKSHFMDTSDHGDNDTSMNDDSFIFGSNTQSQNTQNIQFDPESVSDEYIDSIQADYIRLNDGLYGRLAALGLVSDRQPVQNRQNGNLGQTDETDDTLLDADAVAVLTEFLTGIKEQDNQLQQRFEQQQQQQQQQKRTNNYKNEYNLNDLTQELFNLDITASSLTNETNHQLLNQTPSKKTSKLNPNPNTLPSENPNTPSKAALAQRLNHIAWLLDLPPVAHQETTKTTHQDKPHQSNQTPSKQRQTASISPNGPLDNYFGGVNYGDLDAILNKLSQLEADLVHLELNLVDLGPGFSEFGLPRSQPSIPSEQGSTNIISKQRSTDRDLDNNAPSLPVSIKKTLGSDNGRNTTNLTTIVPNNSKSIVKSVTFDISTNDDDSVKHITVPRSQPFAASIDNTRPISTAPINTGLDISDIKPPKSHTQVPSQQSSSIFNTSLTSILAQSQKPMNDNESNTDFDTTGTLTTTPSRNQFRDNSNGSSGDGSQHEPSRFRAHSPLRDFTARVNEQHMSPTHTTIQPRDTSQQTAFQHHPLQLDTSTIDFSSQIQFSPRQVHLSALDQPTVGGFSPRQRQQPSQLNPNTTFQISNPPQTNHQPLLPSQKQIEIQNQSQHDRPRKSSAIPTLITTTITPIKRTPGGTEYFNPHNNNNLHTAHLPPTLDQDNSFNLNSTGGSTTSLDTTITPPNNNRDQYSTPYKDHNQFNLTRHFGQSTPSTTTTNPTTTPTQNNLNPLSRHISTLNSSPTSTYNHSSPHQSQSKGTQFLPQSVNTQHPEQFHYTHNAIDLTRTSSSASQSLTSTEVSPTPITPSQPSQSSRLNNDSTLLATTSNKPAQSHRIGDADDDDTLLSRTTYVSRFDKGSGGIGSIAISQSIPVNHNFTHNNSLTNHYHSTNPPFQSYPNNNSSSYLDDSFTTAYNAPTPHKSQTDFNNSLQMQNQDDNFQTSFIFSNDRYPNPSQNNHQTRLTSSVLSTPLKSNPVHNQSHSPPNPQLTSTATRTPQFQPIPAPAPSFTPQHHHNQNRSRNNNITNPLLSSPMKSTPIKPPISNPQPLDITQNGTTYRTENQNHHQPTLNLNVNLDNNHPNPSNTREPIPVTYHSRQFYQSPGIQSDDDIPPNPTNHQITQTLTGAGGPASNSAQLLPVAVPAVSRPTTQQQSINDPVTNSQISSFQSSRSNYSINPSTTQSLSVPNYNGQNRGGFPPIGSSASFGTPSRVPPPTSSNQPPITTPNHNNGQPTASSLSRPQRVVVSQPFRPGPSNQ